MPIPKPNNKNQQPSFSEILSEYPSFALNSFGNSILKTILGSGLHNDLGFAHKQERRDDNYEKFLKGEFNRDKSKESELKKLSNIKSQGYTNQKTPAQQESIAILREIHKVLFDMKGILKTGDRPERPHEPGEKPEPPEKTRRPIHDMGGLPRLGEVLKSYPGYAIKNTGFNLLNSVMGDTLFNDFGFAHKHLRLNENYDHFLEGRKLATSPTAKTATGAPVSVPQPPSPPAPTKVENPNSEAAEDALVHLGIPKGEARSFVRQAVNVLGASASVDKIIKLALQIKDKGGVVPKIVPTSDIIKPEPSVVPPEVPVSANVETPQSIERDAKGRFVASKFNNKDNKNLVDMVKILVDIRRLLGGDEKEPSLSDKMFGKKNRIGLNEPDDSAGSKSMFEQTIDANIVSFDPAALNQLRSVMGGHGGGGGGIATGVIEAVVGAIESIPIIGPMIKGVRKAFGKGSKLARRGVDVMKESPSAIENTASTVERAAMEPGKEISNIIKGPWSAAGGDAAEIASKGKGLLPKMPAIGAMGDLAGILGIGASIFSEGQDIWQHIFPKFSDISKMAKNPQKATDKDLNDAIKSLQGNIKGLNKISYDEHHGHDPNHMASTTDAYLKNLQEQLSQLEAELKRRHQIVKPALTEQTTRLHAAQQVNSTLASKANNTSQQPVIVNSPRTSNQNIVNNQTTNVSNGSARRRNSLDIKSYF